MVLIDADALAYKSGDFAYVGCRYSCTARNMQKRDGTDIYAICQTQDAKGCISGNISVIGEPGI